MVGARASRGRSRFLALLGMEERKARASAKAKAKATATATATANTGILHCVQNDGIGRGGISWFRSGSGHEAKEKAPCMRAMQGAFDEM